MKSSKVKFISERLEKEFKNLDENDPIKRAIKRAIIDLQQDAFFGIQIPKRIFPKEYIQKYQINNLWKYDLPNGWRLIYTITSENQVQIVTAILEWFNHPEYERRFNY
jgi:mRNA-degrading endonuclease RelE of RelBE toxin-antitoxin system